VDHELNVESFSIDLIHAPWAGYDERRAILQSRLPSEISVDAQDSEQMAIERGRGG
jgi:hypothetical protein